MKILDIPQSGSIAAQTSSRNRSGQYRRSRVMPVQPRTALQLAARARLSDWSSAWRGLEDAERAAWTAFANSFTVVNSLGQAIHLTGAQSFVKVSAVQDLLGEVHSDIPPALPAFTACLVTSLTGETAPQLLKLAGTGTLDADFYMVYASPQRSAGVSFEGTFRYLEAFAAFDTGFMDILATYTAKFGALIDGKKIFVKVVQVQAGMQDNGTLFSTVVAAHA
jgi:hypothetical protein